MSAVTANMRVIHNGDLQQLKSEDQMTELVIAHELNMGRNQVFCNYCTSLCDNSCCKIKAQMTVMLVIAYNYNS